jgi:hypothetical protein
MKFFKSHNFEVNLNNVIYKWLLTLYIDSLPKELTSIIWDALFLDGQVVLFKAALGIIKTLKNKLLEQDSMLGIHNIFDHEAREVLLCSNNNLTAIVYYLTLRKFEFDNQFIIKNRMYYEKTVTETLHKRNQERLKDQKSKMIEKLKNNTTRGVKRNSCFNHLIECEKDWPLCIYDTYYKYDIINYLVFTDTVAFENVYIIEDYFFNGCLINEKNDVIKERSKNSFFKKMKTTTDENRIKKLLSCQKVTYNKKCGEKEINLENYCGERSICKQSQEIVEYRPEEQESFKNLELDEATSSQLSSKINRSFCYFREENEEDVIEEQKKLEIYKKLMIERRTHYCTLLNYQPNETVTDVNSLAKKITDTSIKNIFAKSSSLQKCRNKSFTANHPYFVEIYSSKPTNNHIAIVNYSHYIRKHTFDNIHDKEHHTMKSLFNKTDNKENKTLSNSEEEYHH